MDISCDPEMLELFRAEMDTHLPALSRGLLAMEKGAVNAQEIEAMMRAAHSIKGAARIVGIEPAVRLSHVMEDFFTVAKENRVAITSAAADVLLEGVDALQRICSPRDGEAMTDAGLAALIQKISDIRQAVPSAASSVAMPTPALILAQTLVAGKVDRCELSVALPAQWDEATIIRLHKELLDTISLRPTKLLLDFASVQRLSARAITLLVSLAQAVEKQSPATEIHAGRASQSIQHLLQVCGLSGALGLSPAIS